MRRFAPATITAAFLLFLAVVCAATANAAISFRLNSRDFVPWLEAKPVEPSYAMANAHNGVCVLVQLDNGLGGVIRFTYSSNVTDVRERADLLVSVHRPSTSTPSMAAIDGADKITDTKIFNAAQLHRTNVEANVVRRSKERQGTNDVTADEEMARSTTLTLRPVQDGTGPSAHFVDGNYAACFLLVARAANAANTKPAPVYEEVQLRLLEVASTSHSTSTYIARLSNPVVNQQGGDNLATEADREYAKMIRNLFRTNKNTNLQNLLNPDAVVSSEEMHQQLEALKAVQTQLFSLYSSSEYLEERFMRMRSTAETTFTRIWFCMILTLAVMGATIWLTFHFTKDIIVKRKLI